MMGFQPKYLLRWRFDFVDKPTRLGMWNSPTGTAWNVNKEGIVAASIEGKNILTREVITLVQCEGHEFVNFKWHAIIKGHTGRFPARPIGMILQTRELDILMLMNGDHRTEQRTEDDKKYNYAGFGK